MTKTAEQSTNKISLRIKEKENNFSFFRNLSKTVDDKYIHFYINKEIYNVHLMYEWEIRESAS